MATPRSNTLPITSTEESYAHFLGAHSDTDTLNFIATFCGVELESVLSWRPTTPTGTFPKGERLLRLRSLLFFAGYQITELYKLKAGPRALALMIGAQVITPQEANVSLGYNRHELTSLWRIVLRGEGYSKKVSDAIDGLAAKHKAELSREIDNWSDKIKTINGTTPMNQYSEARAVLESNLDPAIVAALSRTVTTGTALSRIVLDNNGRGELLSQTSGGADVRELIELLQRLVD